MAHIEQFLKVAARMTAVDNKRAADQRQLDLENALAYARTAAQVSETDKADIEAKQRAIAMARDFATSALRRASEYASNAPSAGLKRQLKYVSAPLAIHICHR